MKMTKILIAVVVTVLLTVAGDDTNNSIETSAVAGSYENNMSQYMYVPGGNGGTGGS